MNRLLPILVIVMSALAAGICTASTDSAGVQPRTVDTSAVQAREVRVVGSQWLDVRADPFLASATIPPIVVDRFASATVSDVLHVVPGLHVRQYGGLGGLQTVSIRGAGSAQSLVLLDGIRLTSVQNGTVDLGLLPASLIGSVDVIRGGAAAIYGANAMSGVVHMHTKRHSQPQAWCTVGGGSFDEVDLRAGGTTILGDIHVSGSVDLFRSQGTYPFRLRYEGAEYDVNRSNADVDNLNAMVHVRGGTWSVFTVLRGAQRGIPGPLVDGLATPSRARLRDHDGMVGINATVGRWGAWKVTTMSSLRVWDQWYYDPDATVMGPRGIDEGYVQRDASTTVQAQRSGQQHILTVRVEGGFADLRGRMLQPDVGSLVIRRSIAAAGDWQWQPRAYADVSLRAAMRADAISDMGTAVSPMLAVHWKPLPDASVRASYSYGFRAPSFNELYYLNYGTSTLRPERSHTVNLGSEVAITDALRAEVDVFALETTDQILAVPTSAVAVSAQNIGRTSSVGMEFGLRASMLQEALIAYWSYTLQDVRDRSGRSGLDGTLLPYVPQEMIGAGVSFAPGDVRAGIQWSYVSHQYAQSGQPWLGLLPSYHVLAANIDVQSRIRGLALMVRLQANNLLDMRYSVIQGFPMPGRSFRVLTTLRWEATS